jgi:hypothetical protein
MLIALNDEQVEEAMQYRKVLLAMQTQEQIRLIRENDNLDRLQKEEQVALAYEALQARLRDLSNQTADEQIRAAERAAQAQESSWNKITAGVTLAHKKQINSTKQTVGLGETLYGGFTDSLISGFQEIGAGSQNLGQVMLKALLTPMADYVAFEGKKHLLLGLWPPNPVELGQGAGLLALSGLIRSFAGGGGGAPVSGGSVGGGGSIPSLDGQPARTAIDDESSRPSVEAAAVPRKSVTLVVQGNYFDTDQTRTKLTEMIREASDATDFKILSVGGQV